MELTEFLLARIAEDEAWSRHTGAVAMTGTFWKQFPEAAYSEIQSLALDYSKRVLAECEMRRRIVDLHELRRCRSTTADRSWVTDHCYVCSPEFPKLEESDWPCTTLRLLALPYADHPEFQEAWRP